MLETSKILSLRDIASQINSAGDLLEILSQLTFAACRHGNWTMGSIMSIDTTEGIAQVIARYDPALVRQSLNDRWNLTDSPALVALQRNEPIYIRDVRESENFTGYRRESLERDYRSVMVIPMHCDDFEGRPMVLSVLSRPIVDLTDELLAFMDVIVHLGAIAVDRHKRLEKERRASKDLQQVLQAHTTLLRHVLENGSVSSLARMVHELFDERAVVLDLTANQVLAGMPPESVAMDADAWGTALGGPMSGQLVKAVRNAFDGVQSDKIKLNSGNGQPIEVRARIEALTVDQESVGALITFPRENEPDQFENMMLESVRFALSIQMMRNFIRFRYESRTQSELFLELVEGRWKDANEFHERARRLGIDLRAPHQLIAIRYSSTAAELKSSLMEAHHVIARMLKKQDEAAVLISMPNGFVCLVPSHPGKPQKSVDLFAKSLIDGAFYHSEKKPVLIISSICEDLSDYPVAWKRGERMIEIALSFGHTGVLSRQDFGPLPILIAAAAKQDVHAFVEDNLGALDEHDRRYRTAYLDTLMSYVREGCRSQACADAMGIHVTTLRYRLMRMYDLFGIDVGTPEKRFAVELALHLHKLVAKAD